MKRKIFILSLLLCLFAPAALTSLYFKVYKKQVKREVKRKIIAGINKEELVRLKFSEVEKQTKLRWEHSREFEYGGEMYDIVLSEVKGDTTYYWCWRDDEETKLNEQLSELLAVAMNNEPQSRESHDRLFKFWESLYCVEGIRPEVFIIRTVDVKRFCLPRVYYTVFTSFHFHPPEIV